MTTSVKNYAKVLHALDVDRKSVNEAKEIIDNNTQLVKALSDPRVTFLQKENVISMVFDSSISSFIKVLCKNKKISLLSDIFDAYDSILESDNGCLLATVICVKQPSSEQLQKIKSFVCKKYCANDAKIEVLIDESIIGGFILKCGDMEYDRSTKGRLNKLQQKLIGDMN